MLIRVSMKITNPWDRIFGFHCIKTFPSQL